MCPPNRVLDDLGREAMAAAIQGSHADILPDRPPAPDPVSVTMPARRIGLGRWRLHHAQRVARSISDREGPGSGAGYCAYRTRRLRRTTKKTAPSPEASRLIVPGSGTAGGLSGSAMVRSYS